MRWGTPNANDGTAKREKRIMRASDRRRKRLERGQRLLNRPIGSIVDLSPEEQLEDWQEKIQTPDELLVQLQQRASVIGPELAIYELVMWDKEMSEKAGEK